MLFSLFLNKITYLSLQVSSSLVIVQRSLLCRKLNITDQFCIIFFVSNDFFNFLVKKTSYLKDIIHYSYVHFEFCITIAIMSLILISDILSITFVWNNLEQMMSFIIQVFEQIRHKIYFYQTETMTCNWNEGSDDTYLESITKIQYLELIKSKYFKHLGVCLSYNKFNMRERNGT